VRISFRCRGEEATAFVYHLGAPVSFASGINTAWYPQVEDPRVDETGWSGLRATGTITFALPPGLAVYTVGHTDGRLKDASRFTFDFPVYFSFSAGLYRVLEGEGASPIAAYFLSERDNESDYVEGSTAVLEVLEATFGDYPHSRFALVEVPSVDARAAGFAGASLDGFILATSSFLDRRFNTAYFGHEIGHQWWGNLVSTAKDRGSMMVSEGMAQFGSLVAVEAIDGPDAAERYRRTGYPGYIALQSGLGYLSIAAAGFDQPIPEANEGSAARIIADGKGFQVWNMLADQVGPDRFFRALKQLVARHSLEPVAWNAFLADLERTLGEDLGWFYDQWFERTGTPFPSLRWYQEDDRVTVNITQGEPTYRMRLEVELEGSGGCRETHVVEVSAPNTTFELATPFTVNSVTLDPRYRILRWTPEYRAEADALAPATAARLRYWSGKNEEAERMLRAALTLVESETEADLHGRRFSIEAVLGQVLAQSEQYEEARVHLEAALRAPSRRTDEVPWVYFLLGTVALALEDHALLQEVRRSIVSADVMAGGTGAPEALDEMIADR
jgi:tetratricopeptide (TPR) repeat protein